MSSQPLDLEAMFPSEVKAEHTPHFYSPTQADPIRHTHGVKRPYEGSRIPTHWRTICSLQLQGHSIKEIAQALDMSITGVWRITQRQSYHDMRDEICASFDREFLSMKPLAVRAFRNALTSNNENTALAAADKFFATTGFMEHGKKKDASGPVTAEDVAALIVQRNMQVNVQVNVTAGDNNNGRDTDR